MRHILRNAIFSIAILVLAVSAIFPVDKNIRLGKDLRGGVSLVYAVQIRPGDNAKDVLNRTIEVLKNRVDPNGMMEISMTAQGRDRIEVTMPLPGDRVKKLAADFDATLQSLRTQSLSSSDVDRITRLLEPDRSEEISRVAGEDAAYAERLRTAALAYDATKTSREALKAAEQEGRPEAELDTLAGAVAIAEREYESTRDTVVRAALSAEEIRGALSLSNRTRTLQDEDGSYITLPSPRQRAIDRIREGHPESTAQLDTILAAYAVLESERRTLDDSSDLKRLLRGAGVLSFRILCDVAEHPSEQSLRDELRRIGPRNAKAPDAGWYKINQLENWYRNIAEQRALERDPVGFFGGRGMVAEAYDGEIYVLCWNTRTTRLTQEDGPWGVAGAFQSQDDVGKPAISFEMDSRGAVRLGDLTRDHVGDKMAVVLDDEIYTAPVLNNAISKSGIITGDFSQPEITYIVRVLTAGSLTARLSPEPISENTLGPELGADNLRQGVSAGKIALITIGVFMLVYYFVCGGIAVFGLLCTAVLVIGAMALNRAAFTLPGIAGVILTFGMAVDANVLIFERIREELERGEDMRSAVKLGHAKAFSSIFDGNVTNLIVCVVLAYTGTPEIKGFAITLGIGVVATLFSALLVTRTIFDAAVTYGGWRATSMLPMAVKPIGRLFSPNIDWIRLRGVFLIISVVYVGLGLTMIVFRGEKMLDTEFRGGVQVTLHLGQAEGQPNGTRHTMTRREVEERVRAIAENAGEHSSLAQIRSAEVLPINAEEDGVTSDTFVVRTTVTDQSAVIESLTSAFQDVLDIRPALEFARAEEPSVRAAPVYQILDPRLGDSIDRPEMLNDVTRYLGGVAIVLENISPAQPLADLEDRIESLRGQPDFSDTTSRRREMIVMAGSPLAVTSAVLLVHDPATSAFDNEDQWWATVATREWNLVRESLTTPTTLAEVRSFSPAVAESFKAKAVASILLSILLIGIYIWVRFGSALYSAAAIACLFHDVLTCVGFVALAEVLWDIPTLQPALQSIGIMPFKIDLNLVAAVLTIIGYSLNDTIIIMDRIRENRGKVSFASRDAINSAINQTISRTVITSGTTMLSIVILYTFGGPGVRAFAFTMLVGVAVGTYSSIAVGAPIVWSKKSERGATKALTAGPT